MFLEKVKIMIVVDLVRATSYVKHLWLRCYLLYLMASYQSHAMEDKCWCEFLRQECSW